MLVYQPITQKTVQDHTMTPQLYKNNLTHPNSLSHVIHTETWQPLKWYNNPIPTKEDNIQEQSSEQMAKERQRLLPPKPPEKQVPRPKPAVPQAATTDEMNEIMKTAITDEQCIPEDVPLKEAIGKKKGLMWPRTRKRY